MYRSFTEVFESLQSRADDPVPTVIEDRKLINCNNNGVTYLSNSDRLPNGQLVCKSMRTGWHTC